MIPGLEYIIILLGLLMGFGLLFLYVKKYHSVKLKKAEKDKVKLQENFDLESDRLNREIKRQDYVINTYKQQINNKAQLVEVNDTNTEDPVTEVAQTIVQEANTDKVKFLSLEKTELEKERKKFQEKNKKLWEQSIAIHKEKERIDILRAEIEARHNEITDSIKYAKRIQNALLPAPELLSEWLPDHFILWKPRDIVSGDFYWIKRINNFTMIVAADCTGHGVPGAFMSMLGIAFLNEIVRKTKTHSASIILEEMREKVKSSLRQTGAVGEQKDGMDMALCSIDHDTMKMYYAGAYNPLYLLRDGEILETKATRNPIGIHIKEKPFGNNEIQLQKGDAFYIFSDGYVDQFGGPDGGKFKSRNFKKLLLELNNKNLSMREEKDILDQTIEDWKGDFKQLDDILVVGVRV